MLGMRSVPQIRPSGFEAKAAPPAVVAPTGGDSLADPTAWLEELFGVTYSTSGVRVSARAALMVPTVSAAIRVISEAAASLEVKVQRKEGSEWVDDEENPAWALLRDEPNEWTSPFELIRDLVIEALTFDQGGFAWVNRVGEGKPFEIIKYLNGTVAADIDISGQPKYRIDGKLVDPADVIHLRGPFDRCPLNLACEAVGIASVMEGHAARLFSRGARPSGVIEFPQGVGEEAAKKAKAAWERTHSGPENAGKTAVLFSGAKWNQMSMNAVDSQFLELRKFQILEICRAFRIPPSMAYELDRATWSNMEQMGLEFLTYTLEPWLLALEGAFRRALFAPDQRRQYRVIFDRDDLTRADLSTRATAINGLISSRAISPNEGRSWLGLQRYEGGDQFANPNTGSNQAGAAAPQEEEQDAA